MGLRDLFLGKEVIEYDPPLQASEWQRDTRAEAAQREDLLRRGELEEDDLVGNVREIHWSARRPKATNVPPPTPGWWAVQTYDGVWAIVEVEADTSGELWWARDPARPGAQRVTAVGLRWSDRPYEVPR